MKFHSSIFEVVPQKGCKKELKKDRSGDNKNDVKKNRNIYKKEQNIYKKKDRSDEK